MSLLKKLSVSLALLTNTPSAGFYDAQAQSIEELRPIRKEDREYSTSTPSPSSSLYLLGLGTLWLQRKRKY